MAHSTMDITPQTISFGNHLLQTRNIASATIVVDEDHGKVRDGFFIAAVAIGLAALVAIFVIQAVGIGFLGLLAAIVAGWIGYKIGDKFGLVLSTGDGKVTALASTNQGFLEKVLARLKEGMTTRDPTFSYHVNVDGLKIVQGNEINVNDSPNANVVGGNAY